MRTANDSFYLAPANLASSLKLSFHPGGSSDGLDTQFGTPRGYYEAKKQEGFTGPFPFFRWKRPIPNSQEVRRVARLIFPSEGLKDRYLGPRSTKPQITFELPPCGQAVEIGIFSSANVPHDNEDQLLNEAGYTAICRTDLGEEALSLAARIIDFEMACVPKGRSSHPISWLQRPLQPGHRLDNLRAVLIQSAPENGQEIVLAEVASLSLQAE